MAFIKKKIIYLLILVYIDPCVKKYKHLNVLKIENQNYYEVRKGKVRVLK